MRLWQALDKAVKELKVSFTGVRKYIITIENDPEIHIVQPETSKYYKGIIDIDVRDWEKVKNAVDNLLEKEI